MAGSIRDRLAVAAAELKKVGAASAKEADRLSEDGDEGAAGKARRRSETAYDSAAAVEAVLAPRGYLLLSKSDERASSSPVRRSSDSLALSVTVRLKEAVMAAAAEYDVPFPPHGLAEEAYQRVLAGEWEPPRPARMPKGMGGGQAVINVMIKSGLRQQLRELLPELSDRLGFKVTESNIIVSYICEELGIERPSTGSVDSLTTRFRKSQIRHWEEQAAGRGLSLQQVVESRMPALLDGSWIPERSSYMTAEKRGPRTKAWSEDERQRLYLPLKKELLAGLRAKADELTESTGHLVYPGSVVRAILTDELGEPAE
ncbi:hypothetical protein ACF1GW_39060 [Streptomyces achromogenes]|uniref:hypothetical protein n=1 Tax=Streptomyces achromogenes TaxID=67255 RepID=UPI0036FB0F28